MFVDHPLAVLATVAIIVVGKAAVAWLIVRAFRLANATALTVAASLAQIGEFSFILIGLALELDWCPSRPATWCWRARSCPSWPTRWSSPCSQRAPKPPGANREAKAALVPSTLSGHDVLIGYGRVGSLIGAALARDGGRWW